MGRWSRLVFGGWIVALVGCSDPIEPTGTVVPDPDPSPAPATPPASPPPTGAAPTGVIAFVSERDGNPEIYTANADGTDVKRLTNDPGYDYDPAWSPDGKRIAFMSSRDAVGLVSWNIYVMNADGSNVVRRTAIPGYSPAWSPDGKHIAFVGSPRTGQSLVYVMDVDGDWQKPVLVGFPTDGLERDPTWSPDGTKVMFTSSGDYTGGLFIANADGSGIRPVYGEPGGLPSTYFVAMRPAWSPDGSKVAILNCTPFPCFETGILQIIKPDGTRIASFKSVNRFPRLTWSPDGKIVAFAQDCANFSAVSTCRRSLSIEYVRVDGSGSGVLFSDAYNPAWRPEPGQLPGTPTSPSPPTLIASDPVSASRSAFVSATPQTFQIAAFATLRNATTGSATVPAPVREGGIDPVSIPASVGDDILLSLISAEGSTTDVVAVRIPVRKPPRVVRTSPGKGRIDVALNVQIEVVFTEPVDRTTVTPSTLHVLLNGSPIAGTLSVSEDGLTATFTPDQPLLRSRSYTVEVTTGIRDLDGDQLEEAEVATFTTANPPAGVIAFVSNRDGNPEIYTINTDGSGLRRLTNDPAADIDPAWSPDGRRIGFTSDRDGTSRIYEMNADGSNVVNRVAGFTPAWSPDGKHIAYTGFTPEGAVAIKVANTTDGWSDAGVFSTGQFAWSWQPSWSPDGKQIVFASNNQGWDDESNINVVNSDGTGMKMLLRMTATFRSYDDGEIYFQPAWSPDGKKIAVVVCHFAPHNCYPYSTVSIMNADGTGLTTIRFAGGPARPTWSPNGQYIAYSASYCGVCKSSIRLVRADGSNPGTDYDLIFDDGYSPAWKPAP